MNYGYDVNSDHVQFTITQLIIQYYLDNKLAYPITTKQIFPLGVVWIVLIPCTNDMIVVKPVLDNTSTYQILNETIFYSYGIPWY